MTTETTETETTTGTTPGTDTTTAAGTPPTAAPVPTRPLLVAAALPSALSLAWTAWSIADMVPAPWPVAVAAGIALDVALVAAVAIAWLAPAAARPAQVGSWIIAALAAAAIGAHSWQITPELALMAVVPLVAKGLWHLALRGKAAADAQAEAAEAERLQLCEELDQTQRAQLAAKRKQAAFAQELAAADVELADAQARADQQLKLAQIRRQNELRLAEFESQAELEVRRAEQLQRVRMSAPLQAHALPAVPDDASSLTPQNPGAEAGFGGAFATAAAPAPATGATAADLAVPQGAMPGATAGATPGGAPAAPVAHQPETERTWPRPPTPEQGRRQLVEYAQWRLDQGQVPSIRDAARRMHTSARSITRYREALREQGGDYAQLMEQFRAQ